MIACRAPVRGLKTALVEREATSSSSCSGVEAYGEPVPGVVPGRAGGFGIGLGRRVGRGVGGTSSGCLRTGW